MAIQSCAAVFPDIRSGSFPNFHGLRAYVQDCWRSRDRIDEQNAVRSLLTKMNINVMELSDSREQTDFCGVSLYRPQPPRNPRLAPKHYVEGAVGKFIPHSPEEQEEIMGLKYIEGAIHKIYVLRLEIREATGKARKK